MKRFNPSELCISLYDVPKDPQQPLPKDYGISYRLIEEYEQRIEQIEKKWPPYYNPTSDTHVSEVGKSLPQSPEGAFRTQAGVKPLQKYGGNFSPEGAAEHTRTNPSPLQGLCYPLD